MSLEYKILGQELVSYTVGEGTVDTTSYYVSYEEALAPLYVVIAAPSSTAAYSTDGITWTQTTLPRSAFWWSVTYGDGKFVAVSLYPNVAAYSTDGISWTETTLPAENFRSVTYGDGKFVAIGAGSNIAVYSTDGITWTQTTTLPTSTFWYDVTYGDGKFVAIAYESSTAAYSLDGITWTQTTLPASATGRWHSVTYGGGKFVTVLGDNSNTAAYSTDGITWTATTLPTIASWREVAYGNGTFVAIPENSNIAAYSTDGINWAQATLPTSAFWYSLTHGDGKFVAVTSSNSIAAYSTDGITWTQTTLPNAGWRSVGYGETIQLTETLNIIGGQGTVATEEFLPVTFYTVPAGKQTTVTSVFVANHNSTATTYDFAVVPAGEELSLKHHLRWDMEIAANDFENISTKITMSAGDKLVIFPSTVDTVSVTAFGVEK